MKILLKSVGFISILLILTACPDDNTQSFRFINNSNRDVYIHLVDGDRVSGDFIYTDTAISYYRGGELFEKGTYHTSYYRDEGTPVHTWCLFIFDADTLNSYSWEEIKSGYKILQRYDMSTEELEAFRDGITYPPTEAMRNIKMYPPYGQ